MYCHLHPLHPPCFLTDTETRSSKKSALYSNIMLCLKVHIVQNCFRTDDGRPGDYLHHTHIKLFC